MEARALILCLLILATSLVAAADEGQMDLSSESAPVSNTSSLRREEQRRHARELADRLLAPEPAPAPTDPSTAVNEKQK